MVQLESVSLMQDQMLLQSVQEQKKMVMIILSPALSFTSQMAPRLILFVFLHVLGDDPGYRGMSLIITPTNLPGFSVGRKLRKLGNYSSDTGELVFDHVRVPQWYRIGAEGKGFQLQMQQFQKSGLLAQLWHIADARELLEILLLIQKSVLLLVNH